MFKKNILRFAITFLVIYIAILMLYNLELVRKVHVQILNVSQQFCMNLFHPDIQTDFRAFEINEYTRGAKTVDKFDFSMYIYDKSSPTIGIKNGSISPKFILNQNSNLSSIGPIILFISLLLAGPTSWKRKIIGAFVGLLLLSLFLALKLSFIIDTNAPQLHTSGFSIWMGLSKILGNTLRTHEGFLLLTTSIWVLVCIGKKEIQWFME